jgi:hypothetical protein
MQTDVFDLVIQPNVIAIMIIIDTMPIFKLFTVNVIMKYFLCTLLGEKDSTGSLNNSFNVLRFSA